MPRLIDADALIEEIKFVKSLVATDSDWLHGHVSGLIAAVVAVIDAPTIDAVPVVRCKDCKIEQICKLAQHLGENGFCSYGERKDDD